MGNIIMKFGNRHITLNFCDQKIIEPHVCIICWENINVSDLCICTKCPIRLHKSCEETYRGTKEHCHCPHCGRNGTIGYV
jgi:hypothetical protein